jgi:hypothetical protein
MTSSNGFMTHWQPRQIQQMLLELLFVQKMLLEFPFVQKMLLEVGARLRFAVVLLFNRAKGECL